MATANLNKIISNIGQVLNALGHVSRLNRLRALLDAKGLFCQVSIPIPKDNS